MHAFINPNARQRRYFLTLSIVIYCCLYAVKLCLQTMLNTILNIIHHMLTIRIMIVQQNFLRIAQQFCLLSAVSC